MKNKLSVIALLVATFAFATGCAAEGEDETLNDDDTTMIADAPAIDNDAVTTQSLTIATPPPPPPQQTREHILLARQVGVR